MLKEVQSIARADVLTKPLGTQPRAPSDQERIEHERHQLDRFVARCDEYLARPRGDGHPELEALCAEHVARAAELRRRAFDELCAVRQAADRPKAGSRFSAYATRVRADGRRVFDELFARFVERAARGDRPALAELEAAAGIPAATVLAIAGGHSGEPVGDGEPGVPPQRAFDSLHERFEKVILGYIRARLNERDDPADADDIAQDAWEAVWTDLSEYNPARAPFHGWVKQQALYAIRRYGQRKEYRRKVEVFDTEEEGEAIDLPPPDWGDAAEGYARLLAALGRSSSPPHQVIAFGFCKLLGWAPRRIAAELSLPPLADLAGRLEDGYLDTSRLPEWLVQRSFAPLQDRMELRFAAAVTDRKTLATYPSLHDRIVGETTFTDYYTDEPTADITQWWWAVKRRVLSDVLGGSR